MRFGIFKAPVLFCWLAILVLPASALADAAGDSDGLRAAAARLLADGSPDDAVKAADLLDTASQIDVRARAQSKGETLIGTVEQVIANGLAPLISTIVLGGTLAFNVYQAKVTERDKRRDDLAKEAQAAEDKKRQDQKDWIDNLNKLMTMLLSSNHSLPTAALLGSLMDGPYGSQVREVGVSVMRSATSLDDFKDLFQKFFKPLTYQNLDEVLGYLRDAHATAERLWSMCWDSTKNVSDTSRLLPGQLREMDFQSEKRKFLSIQLAELLKQPDAAPPGALDLSGLGFEGCDLSGANFHRAAIGQAVWRNLVLDGSDLQGVTNFGEFWIEWSAWWRAGMIDPPFLTLLDANFGFAQNAWVRTMAGSLDKYNQDLARLTAGSTTAPAPAAS